MTETPTIDDQIAAVRQAEDALGGILGIANTKLRGNIRAALASLEQHKLALAVVEAARQAVLQIRVHGTTYHRLTDALAAFDAGEKPR
jgi:hypothetical protein